MWKKKRTEKKDKEATLNKPSKLRKTYPHIITAQNLCTFTRPL